ncbi:MAG: KamA family radical SAM protein [bacterium]|nr:KamA family radical SAM protein [bacterium]
MLQWIKQEKNAIRTVSELQEYINLSKKELSRLEEVCQTFQMKITPYYMDLIDKDDPNDPLKLLAIPNIKELNIKKGELDDPIGDTNEALGNQPEKALTHRYPDRVLLYPTPECGGYCRHCFRRRLAGKKEFQLSEKQMDTALKYIDDHKEIREVIFTGGDPLMLSDKRIDSILAAIHQMEHIVTIRIHTRMPVWNPYRLTDKLVSILKKYQPLWLVSHFNHPRELSETAVEHLNRLTDNGIPLLNQAVLLKGINDSVEIQRDLNWALIKARVKPYYLHQLDKARGISHFRVSIRKGMGMLRDLRGSIPGYAIPHYILDIPGGYGKIPMDYHYLNSDGNGLIIVETPFGELRPYIDGVDKKPDALENLETVHPLEVYSKSIKQKIEEVTEHDLQEN